MQNQLSYSVNLTGNYSSGLGSPKFAAQNYPKPLDKTLPTPTLKHYSSNPNLSLEVTHPRPHPLPDFTQFNSQIAARNPDYRGHLSPSTRTRSDLTKSLIMGEADRRETPEEVPSPKKEITRNMPRRPRMSETIEEGSRDFIPSRREEPVREVNFFKNKEERGEEVIQEKQGVRQAPSFLNRANSTNFDMKRSLVVDTSFEHRTNLFPPREKQARRVRV